MARGEEGGPLWRRVRLGLFKTARPPVLALFRLLFGLRIEGLEQVPAEGGALVISNHLHNLDPIILEAAFPRPVHFMAKKEIFPVPVVGWIVRQTGSFPVDRQGGGRDALRYAERLLDRGILVGVFPEGTRSTTGGLIEPFAGSALLASRSKSPIVPTAVFGTERLPFNGAKGRRGVGRGRGVTVRVGAPFTLPETDAAGRRLRLSDQAELMMLEIARLLPPPYRGIYAEKCELGECLPSPAGGPSVPRSHP